MDPITMAAVIGAVGGIGESIISGIGQKSANRENREMSREQMAFQERMSSTAHQRSVSDMTSAGLNPLYWLKGGASTPSGSLSRSESVAEGIRGTTAKALEARIQASQIKNLDVQNAQIVSQTAVNMATAKKVIAETNLLGSTTGRERFISSLFDIPNSALSALKELKPDSIKYIGKRDADRPGDKHFLGGLIRARSKGVK